MLARAAASFWRCPASSRKNPAIIFIALTKGRGASAFKLDRNNLAIIFVPRNQLAASYTREDGQVMDGSVAHGFDIVDSFHAPLSDSSRTTSFNVNTQYGGGYGTGVTGNFGNYAGRGADGADIFY